MIEMNPFDLAIRKSLASTGSGHIIEKIRLQQADEHLKGKDVRTWSVYYMFMR